MREELLRLIETNSRIDVKELSKMLNVSEVDVLNELTKLALPRRMPSFVL